jgi:fructose-specific phosphotransferase system IIC component
MNPTTGLKWSAAFFTVFWTAGMLLWSGAFNPANVVITIIGGIIAGYLWYRMMRWVVIGRELSPRQHDQG